MGLCQEGGWEAVEEGGREGRLLGFLVCFKMRKEMKVGRGAARVCGLFQNEERDESGEGRG